MARNEIPQELASKIVERPEAIDLLGRRGGQTGKGRNIVQLAAALKVMDASKALCFHIQEYTQKFGRYPNTRGYLRTKLRSMGVEHPRIVLDTDKIFIWANKA